MFWLIYFCRKTSMLYVQDFEKTGREIFRLLPEFFRWDTHFYVTFSVRSSVCLSACLPVFLSSCLPVCLSACLPVCLSASLPVCQSVCLSVCLGWGVGVVKGQKIAQNEKLKLHPSRIVSQEQVAYDHMTMILGTLV